MSSSLQGSENGVPHAKEKRKPQELQPTVQDVEQLRMFPCLDDNTIIRNLPWQEKLPAYLAEIKDVQVRRGDEIVWCHKLSSPHWSSATYNLALVQPSSVAAERVLSILRSHFDDHQAGALLLMREHCRALFHFLSTKRALNAQKMGDAPSTKSLKNEHYLHRPTLDYQVCS